MKIPAIAGPTACGKSELAIRVAIRLNGEIISADSGAVYREMDIGTAKPSAAMRAQIPHHLINITQPDETYHVGNFVKDACAAVADIQARGKTPIFVGGTMMYFNTLLNGLSAIPPIPPKIADWVAQKMAHDGIVAMHKELAEIDAASAAKIAATDKQRTHRALAVYHATGIPLSAWTANGKKSPLSLRLLRLIPQNRASLHQRIDARLQQMWAAGLEAETDRLLNYWRLPPDAPPLRMAGYRQVVCHLLGEYNKSTMQQKAATATHQIAKRQLTWLNRWTGAATIDPFTATDGDILQFFNGTHK